MTVGASSRHFLAAERHGACSFTPSLLRSALLSRSEGWLPYLDGDLAESCRSKSRFHRLEIHRDEGVAVMEFPQLGTVERVDADESGAGAQHPVQLGEESVWSA